MSADPNPEVAQARVRLLTDSQLLDPDADLSRLVGLCDVARELADVEAASVEVQLADGEWRTAARSGGGAGGPAALGHRDAAPLVTAEGLQLGCLRLWDGDEARLEEQTGSATEGRQRGLTALADAVVAIVESEAGATRVFEADEEAARAEAELSRVAGQISHDLNNPLAALAMSLEIALDQADDLPPLVTSLLERATSSAARMKRMTADLLSFGQVPSHGASDLQEELDVVLDGVRDLWAGEVRVAGPLPRLAIAPADLRVVLLALIENAVKFAGPDEPADVEVAAAPADAGRWRVTVADRGRGVPEEDRARVLAPMVRLDKRVPGLGLGLATVHRVVTANGGEVGLEAREGGGTTVWFTLPAAAGSGPALHDA